MPTSLAHFFTKKDVVAEWLRNEILNGALDSGTQLQQSEIAERLNVSPTPVREAFRQLEAEGLVISRPHRGVVVAHDEWADITALYELRTIVETAAMRRVIKNHDAGLLARLRRLAEQSERAMRTADLEAAGLVNGEFHVVLMGATGSRVYGELAKSLISRSRYYVRLDKTRMREVGRQHRAIIAALASREPTRAVRLMERHMNANLKWLHGARTIRARARRKSEAVAVGG